MVVIMSNHLSGLAENPDDLKFMLEMDLSDKDTTFDDYSDAVIQYGFVNLFSVGSYFISIDAHAF
jgi:hypothetical protein